MGTFIPFLLSIKAEHTKVKTDTRITLETKNANDFKILFADIILNNFCHLPDFANRKHILFIIFNISILYNILSSAYDYLCFFLVFKKII